MTGQRIVAPQSGWRIFRWPLAVALLSIVGLVSALIGDGWHDVISWIALGSMIVLMVAAWRGGAAR